MPTTVIAEPVAFRRTPLTLKANGATTLNAMLNLHIAGRQDPVRQGSKQPTSTFVACSIPENTVFFHNQDEKRDY